MRKPAAATREPTLTLAQWADLDEDAEGELVDGRVEEEEAPTNLHELVVAWLLVELGIWARAHGGVVYGSEHKLAVAPRRGRKADLSVYLAGARHPDPAASLSTSAPGVVVEVLSPRPRDQRRDRIDKARDYARFGVRWYWIVDPAVRLFEVRELGPGRRYLPRVEVAGGRIRIPGCRGLVLDLEELWRHTDGSGGSKPASRRGGRARR